MKKRAICMAITVAVLIVISSLMLVGCGNKDDNSREVVIELINPNTGDVMKEEDRIDLPEKETYVDVKIKDKETGAYLTDGDLQENTIKDSLSIVISRIDSDGIKISATDRVDVVNII